MNVYTPSRYDERVFHLAIGVEPRDALSNARLPSTIDVRREEFASPVDAWRNWRPGETLTAFLPRLHRHRSGRFVRRYDEGVPDTALDVRIIDDGRSGQLRLAGQGRRIVPRRVRVPIVDEGDVLDAEADPLAPPIPIWQRSWPVSCFPGAAVDLAARTTTLRGTVVRDDGTGTLVPVRWARIRARNAADDDVGWAHGDDRGEFVLVIEQSANDIVAPIDPLPITLTVGADAPAVPNPADPTRAVVDPLWDLAIEDLVPAEDPDAEPTLTGRSFLASHAVAAPLSPVQPIELPHGRETSALIQIA